MGAYVERSEFKDGSIYFRIKRANANVEEDWQ